MKAMNDSACLSIITASIEMSLFCFPERQSCLYANTASSLYAAQLYYSLATVKELLLGGREPQRSYGARSGLKRNCTGNCSRSLHVWQCKPSAHRRVEDLSRVEVLSAIVSTNHKKLSAPSHSCSTQATLRHRWHQLPSPCDWIQPFNRSHWH